VIIQRGRRSTPEGVVRESFQASLALPFFPVGSDRASPLLAPLPCLSPHRTVLVASIDLVYSSSLAPSNDHLRLTQFRCHVSEVCAS
jgi:hypothetical protein